MRYIINTEDSEGIIGIQIDKWKKEGKLVIIEKGNPIVEIQEHLERVAKALEVLSQAGYNKAVMHSFIHDTTKLSKQEIYNCLNAQEEFFKQIGVLK
jgi:rhodanese-related sulfurtransferase